MEACDVSICDATIREDASTLSGALKNSLPLFMAGYFLMPLTGLKAVRAFSVRVCFEQPTDHFVTGFQSLREFFDIRAAAFGHVGFSAAAPADDHC